MFREDLKKIKITQLVDSTLTKNMQNLPIKFPNKKGILVSTPTLLKYMPLSVNKFKLGFYSDIYLPFWPKSRFLLFFWTSSLIVLLQKIASLRHMTSLMQQSLFDGSISSVFLLWTNSVIMYLMMCTVHIPPSCNKST